MCFMSKFIVVFFILIATSSYAEEVRVNGTQNDSSGASLMPGTGNPNMTSPPVPDSISGVASGQDAAGIFGQNLDPLGWAGYFDGNTWITGNLTVQGTLSGETDPQVGLLTNGKWCRYESPYVNCLMDPPVLSESDPTYHADPAAGISSTQISHWNQAFAWGDHSTAAYDTTADSWWMFNGKLTTSSKVGIGTKTPTHSLDIVSPSSGAFIGIDFATNNNSGISFFEGGAARWIFPFFRGWQSDNMMVRNEVSHSDVMTFQASTDNVGIGTSSPTEKLTVNGNLKVEGTGNGVTFPDGTQQTTACTGFPSPNYDSGWVAYSGNEIVLTHNLGGNIDNYVVDLTMKDGNGPHIGALGGDWRVGVITHIPLLEPTWGWEQAGVHWKNLTATTVKINSGFTYAVDSIRLRIWVY